LVEGSKTEELGEVDDEVYDTITVDILFIPRKKETAHLPSPGGTPPPLTQPIDTILSVSTPSSIGFLSPPPDSPLQGATGNLAPHANEISSQIDESNILTRSQRSAYATALLQVNKLSGYHSAFSTALKLRYYYYYLFKFIVLMQP
jgi:hypothetical protein